MNRTKFDLLDLPQVFTQRSLLTRDAFWRECRRRLRGLSLSGEELEALHQAGVLRPFYRLRKDVRAASMLAKREGRSAHDYLLYTPTDGLLKEDRDEGNLFDPTQEPFRTWRSYRVEIDDLPVYKSEFLFSYYQLLGIDSLRHLFSQMRGRRMPDGAIRYGLRLRPWTLIGVQLADDALVTVLTALEEYYLPEVLRVVRLPLAGEEARRSFENEFDPMELLEYLGLEPDKLRGWAENLLIHARHVDPMKDWIELVRLVQPQRWSKLEGDALVALDLRVAAEMLLLFHEHLASRDALAPLPDPSPTFHEPLRDRLKPDRGALDRVLSDFGLSPHPGAVLVLEGESEMVLVPRVMEELGIPDRPSLLRLFGAGGVNRQKQLELLAAYVATPTFGRELQQAVLLDTPPTHFIGVFDPDQGLDTPERRERYRRNWVAQITRRLPEIFRTVAIEREVDRMVSVDTWDGSQVFEFANFTDGEIATALNKLHRMRGGKARAVAAADVKALRPKKDLARLWQGWPGRKVSKRELASVLWPALQRRLNRMARANRLDEVPIARVVLDAARIAYMASRARAISSREGELQDSSP